MNSPEKFLEDLESIKASWMNPAIGARVNQKNRPLFCCLEHMEDFLPIV